MATSAPTTVSTAELADADVKFKKALELRDSDLETAVVLLGQVLETRNKAYGENAPECADTYLYYGECLFEQAQAASDFFGDQMKSAANQRAKAIAADAEAASGDDAEDAGGDTAAAAAEDKGTKEAEAAQADAAPNPDEGAPPAAADDANKQPQPSPAAPAATPEDAPAAQAGSSKPTEEAAATDAEAPAADPSEGKDEGNGEGEAAGEVESEGDEVSSSSGDEDAEECGEEAAGEEGAGQAAEAPEVTGESDDMVLAWEMLELARLIYNNNGGAATHANKLADCHMYIGDILAEQEKFESAVEEYKTAQEMLAKLEGGHDAHRRRAAELLFKQATALEVLDSPAEALAAMQSAKAYLTAHLDTVNADIAKAGSSGTDVSGAVASAAFASILSGYASSSTPAAASTGGEQQKDGVAAADGAKVAKLTQQAADLKGTIDSINDRIEELTAAVQERVSMKEQLANLFKSVAAEPAAAEGSSEQQQQPGAGSSAGAVETIGFGAAGSSKAAAGEVKDIGVIGKGKRVAPAPVEAPCADPTAVAAADQPTAAAEAAKATTDQATTPTAADDSEGLVGKKRPLSDVTSSDQEQAAGEGAGAEGAAAKVAAAAAAQAVDQDAAPKRARV